jgi:MarR family transcriptional regulator for hemolysin
MPIKMYTEFEQQIGFLLHDISRLTRKCMGMRLADLNLSEARWRVLATINRFPEIGQTELADLLVMTKASLGSLLDKLEAETLIERKVHPTDRRIKRLNLTPKGFPISTLIRERYALLETDFMKGITSKEQALVVKQLRTVYIYLVKSSDTRLDSIEQLQFSQLLGCISRLNSRRFESQLKDIGFTRPQWLVLTGIYKHEGLQQNAIAKALSMKKAPLGIVVDELEKSDWVKRCLHPEDRRAKQLFLTERCKLQLARLRDEFGKLHEDILPVINQTQRKKFTNLLNCIRSNLQYCAADIEIEF